MQVTLTPRAEEFLKNQLAQQPGQEPEQIVEWALERLALQKPELSKEERERRRQAVEALLEFRRNHHLTLGLGVRMKDLIREGHKY